MNNNSWIFDPGARAFANKLIQLSPEARNNVYAWIQTLLAQDKYKQRREAAAADQETGNGGKNE